MESYRRSRMVDSATSTDCKITPVYKLEEVAEILRSSDVGIVREVSELILKRLDHKDPVVKHKVLRLIKYAAGKSSSEFQREMQRNSPALRQLLHYKGHPDPLKGDALNKAVRDSAQEAIAAIFSEHETVISTTPPENLNRRIEGFGNTNFHPQPPEDKKSSFLSGVVGFGTASIKQGLNSLARGRSFIQHGNPNSKGRNLWRSLTVQIDYPDKYVEVESPKESKAGLVFNPPRNGSNGFREERNGESDSICREDRKWVEADEPDSIESKTREEKLVETIVTSSGVRLQPTRDNVTVFLTEAAKLDGVALSRVLESKIRSPQWQVRMRAVCVLESIIRKKSEEEDEPFSIVAAYFVDKKDALVSCLGFPQASLQEKAKRVLGLLDGESTKAVNVSKDSAQIPNLIDTGDAYSFLEGGVLPKTETDRKRADPFDDLLGDGIILNVESHQLKSNADPFADVSFDTQEPETTVFQFVPNGRENPKLDDIHKLMAGLSINQNSNSEKYPIHNGDLSRLLGSQEIANATFGNGSVPNNNTVIMFDTRFVSPAVNYSSMSKSCNQPQEETQAFDFIADHLTAVRDLKKVT